MGRQAARSHCLKLQMQSRSKEKETETGNGVGTRVWIVAGGSDQIQAQLPGSQAFVPVLGRKRGLEVRQATEMRPLRQERCKTGKSTLKCGEDANQHGGSKRGGLCRAPALGGGKTELMEIKHVSLGHIRIWGLKVHDQRGTEVSNEQRSQTGENLRSLLRIKERKKTHIWRLTPTTQSP